MLLFREIAWCEDWPSAVTKVVTGLKHFSLLSNDGVEVAVPTADTDAGSLSAAAFPLKVCLQSGAELMVHGQPVHFDLNELEALFIVSSMCRVILTLSLISMTCFKPLGILDSFRALLLWTHSLGLV